ncbi:TPA: class I tRNA ligase family protein, partial [Candidatus Woesearchaeota archaeon]|nr:class I tRNA ligase family protein [Candidatus Woesearchaeota archaeon]
WFIKYSDQEITDKTKEHVKSMNIYPHEFKEHLPGILDWFADRACTRLGNWLGSTFPFDDTWTVEPISDSTLYPCYYIVSKFVQNGTVSIGELDETFFDYVYLGIGEGKESWKPIRAEFEYFYPLDMNLGGKEHKTVHFPVFLMNHVAILPKDKWPKGIFANWWVTGKGSKISKSKGGAEPIPNAIATYGVDAMRLYYAHIGSPHVDVVWDESVVGNYKHALERIYSLVTDAREKQGSKSSIDVWLISRLHEHIQSVSEKMKEYNLRDLASTVYFTMQDDFRWYLRRGGFHKSTIDEFIETWCVLMNPITPHLSEEMSLQDGLVSVRKWPEARQDKISRNANAGEALLKVAMDGMRNVMKLAKIDKPEKFTLFVAEGWLYPLFEVLSREVKVTRNVGEVMKKVLEQEELKMKGKEVSKIVMSIVKDPSKLPHFTLSQEEEIDLVKNTIPFLEKEFGCSVEIGDEPDHPKAKSSMPGKVGILVE